MARFVPWKQHFSSSLTHDVESPSVFVNDRAHVDEVTGSTHNGGSRTLSRCMKLGFALVALSVAIIVGIALGRSSKNSTNLSQQYQGLQNVASRVIGGSEVCTLFFRFLVGIH
jgi:hypothetical protein